MKTQKPKSSKRRRTVLRVCLLLFTLFLCLLAVDYWAYPYGASSGGRSCNQGENGLWLRYTWYFGEHTSTETQQLALNLQERQIRYAYFHVRSINHAGELVYHKPEPARRLTSALHQSAPNVQVIAWVYAGTARENGDVHLSRIEVRKKMIAEALWLVNECGFDGVQWDYETCDDGDRDFLALLQETRAALPAGKTLSVAAAVWSPVPKTGWSETYFSEVAKSCDQMAVMCYDTGCYLPRSYVCMIGQQARHVPQAVARANPRCRVLLGVPTYGAGLISHNPRAENLALALRGIREGLADGKTPPAGFAGVALFADYTTEPGEWETYRKLWLTP